MRSGWDAAPAGGARNPAPGRLGSPSAPTTWGCLRWLDGTGRAGRKPRDRAGEEFAVRVPEARSRRPKSRDGALSGARPAIRAPAPRGADDKGAARRSVPSGLLRGSDTGPAKAGRNEGAPAPFKKWGRWRLPEIRNDIAGASRAVAKAASAASCRQKRRQPRLVESRPNAVFSESRRAMPADRGKR